MPHSDLPEPSGQFGLVALPPQSERMIVGVWAIDLPVGSMNRSIERVGEDYYLVSRLLDRDGKRVGGDQGLLLRRVSDVEFFGTGRNRSVYRIAAKGILQQFVPDDRQPSMVGAKTSHLWPGET